MRKGRCLIGPTVAQYVVPSSLGAIEIFFFFFFFFFSCLTFLFVPPPPLVRGRRWVPKHRQSSIFSHQNMALQAIRYTRGSLDILDQLLLPHQSNYVSVKTCEDAFDAIKRMVVRGAPAIAIVAALALAVELEHSSSRELSVEDARTLISDRLDYLVQSRPTAVNLSDAATKLKRLVASVSGSGNEAVEQYICAAEKMLVDDVADNKSIGDHGARWILENCGGQKQVAVLTHCNTGYGLRPLSAASTALLIGFKIAGHGWIWDGSRNNPFFARDLVTEPRVLHRDATVQSGIPFDRLRACTRSAARNVFTYYRQHGSIFAQSVQNFGDRCRRGSGGFEWRHC
jgi:hypothetical protein